MADNKNSFTFRQYKRNELIFKIIKWAIGALIVSALFWYTIGLQRIKNSSALTILIWVAYCSIPTFLLVRSLSRQNRKDRQKNYRTWGVGAGNELRVKKELEERLPGYKVISDFQTGRGNVDFVIVSPAGVFTVEVKANRGTVSYIDDQLYVNGSVPSKDFIKQTMAEALTISNILEEKLGKKYFVSGVLEFPNGQIDKNTIHGMIRNIWIGGDKFHEYTIRKSKNRLTEKEMEDIYNCLSSENANGLLN